MGNSNKKVKVPKQVAENFLSQTNFNGVENDILAGAFKTVATDGKLTKNQFNHALKELHSAGLTNLIDSPFTGRLFESLDTNNDGILDLKEFLGGFSLLSKGTPEQKIALSFQLYDLNNDKFVCCTEFHTMIKMAYLGALKTIINSNSELNLSFINAEEQANEFAEELTRQAFDLFDKNFDQLLSFDEFKQFAKSQPQVFAALNDIRTQVEVIF
eukprot:TRINITY_DN58_c0_g4_i1.p2 TRINITY_DN58_c0_g4~~TRINITY_DN58_c0_g4_i1.p2  ORF type:complete len:214 (-),score=95.29 TRINITY_DN58_c0_g4_i1:772-1413(-)